MEEEAGKAAGAEEKVLPWGDFTQRWRYNVKITPSSGAALVKTFEDFQHEWTMDRSATVTRLEEMLRGARATQAGKKDGQHSEHGFALVGKALAEWCRSENASGNPRGTCLGTPCPVRAADGRAPVHGPCHQSSRTRLQVPAGTPVGSRGSARD